jgi:hypothetical protein
MRFDPIGLSAQAVHLSPLAGRGRIALAMRVREILSELGPLRNPPHPDPHSASLCSRDPASGERERCSDAAAIDRQFITLDH